DINDFCPEETYDKRCCGYDESFIRTLFSSRKQYEYTRRIFGSGIRNVATTGTKLLQDLSNESYRETIAYASSIALSDQMNMGFIGDWGTHHIEHALSAVHDIPHGGGMAILFPKWMEYVLDDENVSRFKRFAVNVFGVDPSGKSDKQV